MRHVAASWYLGTLREREREKKTEKLGRAYFGKDR